MDIKKLNYLVQEAFGKGFSGDWQYQQASGKGLEFAHSRNKVIPAIIAKPKFFHKGPFNLRRPTIAGAFESCDQRSIAVYPDFIGCAKKYKELYEKSEGKEVKITRLGDFGESGLDFRRDYLSKKIEDIKAEKVFGK